MRTCFAAELPNLTWYRNTYMGNEGSVTPPTQLGRGPSAPQFWGSLLFMRTPFVAELRNLTGNKCREGVYLGSAMLPSQESGIPELWGSPVFMPTPFNAERPNSAW